MIFAMHSFIGYKIKESGEHFIWDSFDSKVLLSDWCQTKQSLYAMLRLLQKMSIAKSIQLNKICSWITCVPWGNKICKWLTFDYLHAEQQGSSQHDQCLSLYHKSLRITILQFLNEQVVWIWNKDLPTDKCKEL